MTNHWLKNAQQLADMVRELRKKEKDVKEQKEKIRRFLNLNGCRQSMPWSTPRCAKNNGHASVGPIPDKPDHSGPDLKNLQQHECNGAVINVAFDCNSQSNQHNGNFADRHTSKVLHDDSIKLVR